MTIIFMEPLAKKDDGLSMKNDRIFLDTVFVQALLNRRDKYHERAKALLERVRSADEVWTTEAVLVEIGNALASIDRRSASDFIRSCYTTPNTKIVSVDTALFNRALDLYSKRIDKEWGLTDCISIVVMQDYGLMEAVTTDEHFKQAGFRALLIE